MPQSSTSQRMVLLLFLLIVSATLALDQLTKAWAEASFSLGEVVPVAGPLSWTLIYNPDFAFGLRFVPEPARVPLVLLVTIALVYIIYRLPRTPLAAIAGGLIFAGALGNLWDRIHQGAITDFISVGAWPAFNVADSAITVGFLLLIYILLFRVGEDFTLFGARNGA